MPIFTYKCPDCGIKHERIASALNPGPCSLRCEACKEKENPDAKE